MKNISKDTKNEMKKHQENIDKYRKKIKRGNKFPEHIRKEYPGYAKKNILKLKSHEIQLLDNI